MPGMSCPYPVEMLARVRAEGGASPGQLLQLQRNPLMLPARGQPHRHLRSRADPSDLVQETFLAAHRDFAGFRGTTEGEFVCWLRQILAGNLADLVKHYFNARRCDVRLERRLA